MVHISSQFSRLEEMNGVKVSNVDPSSVWQRTVATVLLNMKTKETNFITVLNLKSKDSLGTVREALRKSSILFRTIPKLLN